MTDQPISHLTLKNEDAMKVGLKHDFRAEIHERVVPILKTLAGRAVIPAELTVGVLHSVYALHRERIIRRQDLGIDALKFATLLTDEMPICGRVLDAFDTLVYNLPHFVLTKTTLRPRDEMRELLVRSERSEQLEKYFYASLLEHAGKTMPLLDVALLIFNSIDDLVMGISTEAAEEFVGEIDQFWMGEFAAEQHKKLYGYVSGRDIAFCLVGNTAHANEITDLLRTIVNT